MIIIIVLASAIHSRYVLKSISRSGIIIDPSHYQMKNNRTYYGDVTNHSILTQQQKQTLTPSRLCTRDEIRVGSWKNITLEAPPYIPRTVHLRCYPEEYYKKSSPWETYEWKPTTSECTFVQWKRSEFCRLMQRTTILIIGDSLSWEHYRSLNHLLGIQVSQLEEHQSKAEQENVVHYGCRSQTRIVYRRDDLLTNVSHAIFEEGTFPQVLVINRGAHYKNDTTLIDDMMNVVEDIKAWQQQCAIYNITCHLFWRTSVPGHPHCEKGIYDQPINDLKVVESIIGNISNYDERTIKYHWYDYQHQNEIVLNLLNQSLGPQTFEVLDAYYLNVLRPDEHRAHQGDCLHNCYPGKMDVYNQMLQHFLQIQRTQDDIDALIEWQDRYYNMTRTIQESLVIKNKNHTTISNNSIS